LFCKIVAGEEPSSIVFEDERTLGFMDIAQANPGHVLIIPKDHYPHLAELPPDLGAHLFTIGQRLTAAIRRSGLRSRGMNLFMADGDGFQEIYHVHLHVWPRYWGDAFTHLVVPGWHEWRNSDAPRDELDAVAAQIRAGLAQLDD
jgi:diadenosine tetraphosphate (Ap4A) HIT family hydrolase